MAVVKWTTPSTRSSNLAGTAFNTLANGSAGSAINLDLSNVKDPHGFVTVKLGSLTPTTGGSITLRVYCGDGTDSPDIATGVNAPGGAFDSYTASLTTSTGPKVVTFPMIRVYPFPCIFQIVNNAGASTPGSGNEFYIRTYSEEVS
jgi:hypothetical protein